MGRHSVANRRAARGRSAKYWADRRKFDAESVETMYGCLMPVMSDPFLHAETVAQGKTAFRNTMTKAFRDQRLACRGALAKGEAVHGANHLLQVLDKYGTDAALDLAWGLLAGIGWQNTLRGISTEVGFALPPNTTPDMVMRYLVQRDETEDHGPDGPEMTVRSNMDPAGMSDMWHGSATERTGTMREILASSKIEEVDRGLAAGTHKLVDHTGRRVTPGELRERDERVARDRSAKGAA